MSPLKPSAKPRLDLSLVQNIMNNLLSEGELHDTLRAGLSDLYETGCTPTDNGYTERFVGVLKLTVAGRRPYQTLCDFLLAAEAWVNFYNREWPHESLAYLSPNQFAEANSLQTLPYLPLF
jgi:transposase InsO family protein